MAKDKYDIPYSMAPKNGKKKKSRYSSYIDEQDSFVNRIMSSPAKKLIAYILFFMIFGTCLITALRNSRNIEDKEEYELDLEHSFSTSREQNFIDDSLTDSGKKNLLNDVDNDNIDDIDEIDILDSDDGELAKLVDTPPAKKSNSLKKQFKSSGDEFDRELDDLVASANEQLQDKKNKNNKNNKDIKGPKRQLSDDAELVDKMEAIEAKE